jgi:hypothetical protein
MLENVPWLAKALNTTSLLLLFFGLWNRRRPRVHIPVMVTCIVLDVGNLLLVELTRGAIHQALSAIDQAQKPESWLLYFHFTVSVLFLAGYGVAAASGTKLYRRGRCRRLHKANAVVFLFNRLASYVTSFFV